MASLPKKQHMVPQFLLRNFCDPSTSKLHAFDRTTGRTFPVAVRDAAEKNGFYNFEHGGEMRTLEHLLADLDGAAAAVVADILDKGRVGHLSQEQRHALAIFCAAQMLRVQKSRDWEHQFVDHVRSLIVEGGADPAEVEGFGDPSPEEVRRTAILGILECEKMAIHFLNKPWALQRTLPEDPFWISDNPITLHNSIDRGPRGNLGLEVPGIEMHLPLSKELCLWIVHDSILETLLAGRQLATEKTDVIPVERLCDLDVAIRAFQDGLAVQTMAGSVEFLNSLQVLSAGRFVYGSSAEFKLAKQMLQENPNIATETGFRIT